MKCVDKLLYTFACMHKSEIIQIFVPTLYAFLYLICLVIKKIPQW